MSFFYWLTGMIAEESGTSPLCLQVCAPASEVITIHSLATESASRQIGDTSYNLATRLSQSTDAEAMTFNGRSNVVFVDTAPGGSAALSTDSSDETSYEFRVELEPLMNTSSLMNTSFARRFFIVVVPTQTPHNSRVIEVL